MSPRRSAQIALLVALFGVYGYRTVEGLRAGWAFDLGHLLRNQGSYVEAVRRLERAAVGANRVPALLMAGEVRLDLWEQQVRRRGPLGADDENLVRAAADFLNCRCQAPTARRSWKGLGEVYDAVEWIGREARAETPYVPAEDPWARVGRPGRVAVGLLQGALDTAPSWSRLHDRLALTLWNYGLEQPAREAVRESARALPVYYRHPYHKVPELPAWVAQEFADASREMLGRVPLFPRSEHLIDLGKLERQIGANVRAIEALSEALDGAGDAVRRAEAAFHLGLAYLAIGRYDEARFHLRTALEHPSFRASALRSLAGIAKHLGQHEIALEHLRHLRWEQPGELWPCLEFARVARRVARLTGDWAAALEALRWAKLKHGSDPRPYVELAQTHLEMNKPGDATAVVNELEEFMGPEAGVVMRLRREIADN